MKLKHGRYVRHGDTLMLNVYLSILHLMGIKPSSFADITVTLPGWIFEV